MPADYDILIVGGGMVGASLACALAGHGLSIAVVEAQIPPATWPRDSTDLRVSALTRATQRIFGALGAWDRMVGQRVSPFRDMHVWDAAGSGAIHFDSAEIGEDTLGYIVENRVIQATLWESMTACEDVEVIAPAAPAALTLDQDGARLRLEDGRELAALLVVGADGADSRLRALAGLDARQWDYHQKAVVATVRTEQSHRETAWQRFLPTGPLAFLPLSDGACSIVWSTTPEHADALLARDEDAFRAELAQAFEHRLGRIESAGPRAAFALRMLYAPRYVQPRVALVGDAAHAIHPLAGQGVNLGLLDAAALAEVVLHAHAADRDIGGMATLRRYERWRKGDNLATMAAMDGFKRLFGSRLAPLRWARNVGLTLTDDLGPLKHLIMRRAMGLAGDLPPLARGRV